MQKQSNILFTLAVFASAHGIAATPWINEFHYDDIGGDSGEFVEIAVPFGFTDLASVSLTLYNGGDGRSYASHALSSFDLGGSEGGLAFYSKLIPGIQNGAPDGFALSWTDGVQLISYEGGFVAANGPAAGLASWNIGVAQPDTGASEGSSLGLIGQGDRYEDLMWSAIETATPGAVNLGQTVVPEPRAYVLLAGGGLALFACVRRKRTRAAHS